MGDDEQELPPRVRIWLVISQLACSPIQAAEILDIVPTDTWVAGETVGRSWIRRKSTGLEFLAPSARQPQGGDFITQLKEITAVLNEKASRFQKLPAGADVKIYCEILGNPRSCVIYFNTDSLRAITAVGARIDLDIIS